MKHRFFHFLALFLSFVGCHASAIDSDLARFSRLKEQQIRDFARTMTNKVPQMIWSFFDAVRVDDWQTATNLAAQINAASHRYSQTTNDEVMTSALATVLWPPVSEEYGAYEEFHAWNSYWLHRFGTGIILSIPRGSIYFGGTDPGRFLISVLSESQVEGKPFFTVTQNQLADQSYLDYLRAMYGTKIHIPSTNDAQKVFQAYLDDANDRRKRGALKPGEDIREVNNRVVASGVVAVMEINGLLARKLFEQNPEQQFFVEESYPVDWMYPRLVPHGLIMQLHHQELESVAESEVVKDRQYWKKFSDETLGSWLDEKTPVKEVCDFARKYGQGKNLSGFNGDKAFAANASARKCFSKLRSSIGGLYVWRMDHANNSEERERMYLAADFAFRQSYAICPYSPEALFRYINLLVNRHRTDDAILVAKTSLQIDPENTQIHDLLDQLMKRF